MAQPKWAPCLQERAAKAMATIRNHFGQLILKQSADGFAAVMEMNKATLEGERQLGSLSAVKFDEVLTSIDSGKCEILQGIARIATETVQQAILQAAAGFQGRVWGQGTRGLPGRGRDGCAHGAPR